MTTRRIAAALIGWLWCTHASANPQETAMEIEQALDYAALSPSDLANLRPSNSMEAARKRSQQALDRSQRLRREFEEAAKKYLETT